MIPQILHIKNFLSYGPETQIIDFKPYNLISLSGKNGHGKSALLDAITWAIWGQARKSAGQTKPDAGLMHLGQKHMMVILEFDVNGTIYRVRREFLHTQSKSFATLDFGIQGSDGKLLSLTDKTIKDTQDKIEKMIGITYESFTNSTFLRQGQSNEFSKKSPKERKDVLAQILQLQQFDTQKKIALFHARQQQISYQTKLQIQQRIQQELQDLIDLTAQYDQVLQTISTQTTTIFDKQQQQIKYQQELLILEKKQHEKALLEQQCKDLLSQHTELQQTINKHKQTQTIATDLPPKASLLEQELLLTQQLQQYHKNQQERLQLKEEYLAIKEKIQTIQRKIDQESEQKIQTIDLTITQYEETVKQLKKQIQQTNQIIKQIQQDLDTTENNNKLLILELQQNEQITTKYEEQKILVEQTRQEYQQICAQGNYTKQYLCKITNDQQRLHSANQDNCLQCEQTIDHQQKVIILSKLTQEQQELESTLAQLKKDAYTIKDSLTQHQSELTQHQKIYEHCLQLQARLQQAEQYYQTQYQQQQTHQETKNKQQEEASRITEQIDKLHAQKKGFQQEQSQQAQNAEIVQYTQQLQNIEQIAQKLIFNQQDYQHKEQALQTIRQQLEQYNNQHQIVENQTIIEQLTKQQHEIVIKITQLQEQTKNYQTVLQQQQNLQQQESIITQDIKLLEKTHQELLIQKGSLEQKQLQKKELEKELLRLSSDLKSLHQEMQDYQEIAKALGKDGIQALLIEQAIPEIEHETNQILSRLTNNQTQIFIESLRDLKKGGSKETLDIKIADPFGLRDYELFSGGEAFRIDFALRIGISKLLARRAGTTLQTIFIDEGFGSQDEEGLNLIMDNIHKIQDEFAKIIIVSHLPEMKEHFPVQFVVEKKRSGSTISIIQQG